MSKKCPGCNKTVYFAERQVKDGVDWHGSCLIRFVQDQKKGAQASNPFQSYRGSPSPSAPRRDLTNSSSRPSSVEVAPTSPTPTSPVISPDSTSHQSASPPHTRPDRSPEPVVDQLTKSTEAPDPTPVPIAEETPAPESPAFLRQEERKSSNPQLSKVEEFLLQQTTPSNIPSSLAISVDADATEAQPEGDAEGTGFCSNCGEPRGTDGAKFCSNCGDELF